MSEFSTITDRILETLHPSLRINNLSWHDLWERKDRAAFKKVASITWILFSIAYVLHFYLVDKPLHKTPIELWAKYRFGLALLGLLTVVIINSKFLNRFYYYRFPAWITGLTCSYFQAQSMVWRPELPYFFTVPIAVCTAISLNSTPFLSIFYLFIAYLLGFNAWLSRPNDLHMLISSGVVGMLFVGIIRARASYDVNLFLAEQTQIQTQIQLIEKQQEINEHIRSFLPKKIYKKFTEILAGGKTSVTQAMDEIMRPRKTFASCLYSDIRDFTKLVKNDKNYILHSALPSQKTFNEIVQDHDGIPRNTGDLVFAFFEDEEDPSIVIQCALACAVNVIEMQIELNSSLNLKNQVTRYVSISFGPGIIGNTGGVDGSRDITIFGDCANILSRVDELTKVNSIKELLSATSIILTKDATDLVRSTFPDLPFKEINLKEHNQILRDFTEQDTISIISANDVKVEFNRAPIPLNRYKIDQSSLKQINEKRRSKEVA